MASPTPRMLVTGAAKGIGAATAIAAGEQGWSVLLTDRNPEPLRRTAAGVEAAGGKALTLVADVGDETAIEAMLERCATEFGGLDCLVNAAGSFAGPVRVEELDTAGWQESLRVNLTAPFLACRAAVPLLRRSGRGAIVNVASEAGRSPRWVSGAHYAAAKAGVVGLTRHLALELGEDGITVNAVAPGTTLTERVRGRSSPERIAALEEITPLGRLAEAEEQAAAILFLAGPGARYVNGAVLDVNGGRTMV